MELHAITSNPLEIVFNANVNCKGSIITCKSNLTGKDYTFKISKKIFKDKKFIFVSVETGYLNFTYLGFYWEGKILRKGGVVIDTPASNAIAYIFKQIEKNKIEKLNENVSFYHTGSCVKCGKTLTDAYSIEVGLGPYCRTH